MKCPACKNKSLTHFFKVESVPVHSVLNIDRKKEAKNFKKGNINLAFCNNCAFIFNSEFDPATNEYSTEYEATQSYSGTFNKFHEELASTLIKKYGIKKKELIEIGCGDGEFLELLSVKGNNKGTGFDPAYKGSGKKNKGNVQFVKDYYSEKHSKHKADFICCKMTLEHIQDVHGFMKTVRNTIGNRNTIIFFQVPNFEKILEDNAFWDIYYEHASYFTKTSLTALFKRTGFKDIETWTGYEDQYLMITAKPGTPSKEKPGRESVEKIKALTKKFSEESMKAIDGWKKIIESNAKRKKKTVVWSSSSKAVSFLTTLHVDEKKIRYAVDINPRRQGHFMAGTGQKIISPALLKNYQPDTAIIMNPVYEEEIRESLKRQGLNTELIGINMYKEEN